MAIFGILSERSPAHRSGGRRVLRREQGLCGGASLDQVKDQLKQYVLQQKQQKLTRQFAPWDSGSRSSLAAWAKEQAVLAKDNPVDKARSSGKPTMVDFGATAAPLRHDDADSGRPRRSTTGKANVLFVHVREEQILASRYGIQSIPVQVSSIKTARKSSATPDSSRRRKSRRSWRRWG